MLDLLSCYRKQLPKYFLFFELLFLLIQGMIPYDYGDFALEIISVHTIMIFIMFSNKTTLDIILTMFTLTIVLLVEFPLLSKEKWSA